MSEDWEEEPYGDVPRDRIIERNGGFGRFRDFIFMAVFLGAGGIILEQQVTIVSIERDIAVLKVKCENQPKFRGVDP